MQVKFFTSKKGADPKLTESVILPLGWLLIILFVIFIPTISLGNEIKDNTIFERNFLSLDMASTVNIISNSPGDLYLDYPGKTAWFSFKFEKGNAKTIDETVPVPTESNYPIIEDKNINYIYNGIYPAFKGGKKERSGLEKSANIRFTKNDSKIFFESRG